MGKLRTRIAGHDEHHIAEHSLAALVVAQRAVVHHLKQQIEDVVVRLLDLVEQEDAVRMLAHSIGQQATVLIAHITRGGTDEFGNRVLLDILTHVEPHEFHAQFTGQDTCHLGLAHTGRSDEQQRCQRFILVGESGLGHLHRLDHLLHGIVLAIDIVQNARLQRLQAIVVLFVHREGLDLGDACEHIGDKRFVHAVVLARLAVHLHPCASFVNQVYCFVRQVAVSDVARAAGHCQFKRVVIIDHMMELLIALLEHLQDFECLVN